MIKEAQCIGLLLIFSYSTSATASEFPARVSSADIPGLLEATAFIRALNESSLANMVPMQSGLHYIDCPNCEAGRQEGQLAWTAARPDEVYCRYCSHRYPSEKFPMRESVTVRTPTGEIASFPYWPDSQGYRHFFQAHRDDEVREFLAAGARDLARLYVATNDQAHARRAAVLLDRFAQVFPSWCYHYDYPFQQKQIYDGNVPPTEFRSGYRTARWNWWAYMDIPIPLVQAYDWIRDSGVLAELSRERGVDVGARIERDLFRNAAEQVIANPESYSNMSPTAWRSLVQLGRVIAEPRYVHETVRRLRRFVDTQFFYDGSWSEGSPDYASQTLSGLESVLATLRGYSDPVGYTDPTDGSRFDQLDLAASFPALQQARRALEHLRLPNGRSVPVHDTWPTSRRRGSASSAPYLLPALGHACLGGGSGDQQTQLHLTWSGGYGHEHADNLSLLLFSRKSEMLSDLGYTHTAYRAWTLATVAHNTVVIDGLSQAFGRKQSPTDGSLRYFDAKGPRIQVVSADGQRGYPGLAKRYRRTLSVIDAGEGRQYAVDLFEVDGGHKHDYFLHGDADAAATVTTDLQLAPLATLLPPDFKWTPTKNEGETRRASEPHYPYGFLRGLHSVSVPAGSVVPVTFTRTPSVGPGLRVTLLPEDASQLITGENPSIRRAGEDDAKLEQFMRPFLALRHESNSGRSTFVSILEPYDKHPFLDSVERLTGTASTLALRIRIGERTDIIVIGAAERVSVSSGQELASFQGDVGVLSMRGEVVEHAYAMGDGGWSRGDFRLPSAGPHSAALREIAADTFVLAGSRQPLPEAGDVVRMLTDDGWVYPYTVAAAEVKNDTTRLRVVEGPGIKYDGTTQRLRQTAFPQREHLGAVSVEWTNSVSTQPLP